MSNRVYLVMLSSVFNRHVSAMWVGGTSVETPCMQFSLSGKWKNYLVVVMFSSVWMSVQILRLTESWLNVWPCTSPHGHSSPHNNVQSRAERCHIQPHDNTCPHIATSSPHFRCASGWYERSLPGRHFSTIRHGYILERQEFAHRTLNKESRNVLYRYAFIL